MRLRLKSVMASVVTTGMLVGMLGFAAPAAHAAVTPPPFETNPPELNARGCLTFYDANGNVIRSGDINATPPVAYALGDGPARPGDTSGTLYGALPEPGVPSQNWVFQQMSIGNTFPSSTAPTPPNLRNSPNPLYIGDPSDSPFSSLPAHPGAYDGQYQIRFITSNGGDADSLYWRADIQITGSTWTQTWCAPPAASTTTTLTVSPPSPQPQGTTVNLTATVTPSVATGTVQFMDGTTNLGPAVSTTAGTATTSTNSLSVGTHSLTAVFTPGDSTLYTTSTSPPVSYTITSPPSADMTITKTGPASATVGSPITYTLTPKNNGPDPAAGVTVNDTLPAGETFVSASSSQGTCANSSGTVTCNVGSLASGASATITINATAPTTAGTVTNTATVSATSADPNTANNSASAATTVTPSTDLAVTKTGPATAKVSGPIAYTVTAKNNGPGAATGVKVTDTLPAGVTFVSASAGCTNVSGTVTCTAGNLASGASATFTINVTAPSTAGTITNTATVTGNESRTPPTTRRLPAPRCRHSPPTCPSPRPARHRRRSAAPSPTR